MNSKDKATQANDNIIFSSAFLLDWNAYLKIHVYVNVRLLKYKSSVDAKGYILLHYFSEMVRCLASEHSKKQKFDKQLRVTLVILLINM